LGFFFSSRRRHTRSKRDWSSDVCSSDLVLSDTTTSPSRATGSSTSLIFNSPYSCTNAFISLILSLNMSVCYFIVILFIVVGNCLLASRQMILTVLSSRYRDETARHGSFPVD